MSNLCVTRTLLQQEMFLYRCRPGVRGWTRHPARAHKFASWSEAEAIANLVPAARICTAPVVQQPPPLPTRLELLEEIAQIAGDLHFEAVQHDPSTYRVSRRTLMRLEDALASYHAQEPQS